MLDKLQYLLQTYDFIDFALLFGSFANGRAGPLSDIDVAIHTREKIDLLEQGRMIAALEEATGRKVDLILLQDLYKIRPRLAYNIVSNHKLLLCKSHKAYVDFKTNTYKYYFDMQPLYKMLDEALLKRIDNGTFGKTQTS